MKKLNKLLRYTPNTLLCVLGAVLFLMAFYLLAYRTPLWQVWLPANMDNDEVIYNRQIVSILDHGGPLGYFGYDETHATVGRFGGWGPILIWAYALPGFLFGSSVNTVLWCNVLFGLIGLAVYARAARLNLWQAGVTALGLVCLWQPLALLFCGSSESLHNALTLILLGCAVALWQNRSAVWLALGLASCAFLTISRPYALLLGLFLLLPVWHTPRRRNLCLGVLAASFVVGLINMIFLTAPYFEGYGLDLTALSLLKQGDLAGAVVYQWDHAVTQLRIVWSELLPTLQGDIRQTGAAVIAFLVMVLVTVVCLVYDRRHNRPVRYKVCALLFAAVLALLLVGVYDVLARHLVMPCLAMLVALVVEDARPAVAYLPVLLVLLLPLNAERSSLSTYFAEMGDQVTAVETALTERLAGCESTDPWDYTLAYAYGDDVFHGYLYGVPAGMGIQFDWNTSLADPQRTVYSRYAMVGHGSEAEQRLLNDGWQQVVSTQNLVVYCRPWEEQAE